MSFALDSERLHLRALRLDDADFIQALVNEPSWLEHIGERHVHSREDAQRYLREGPLAMYERHGFGLYAVQRHDDGALLGMCGLIQREGLQWPDIGYALFPRHVGAGYAYEAARAVLDYGNAVLRLPRIAAITTAANARSIALLGRLGLQRQGEVRLPGADEVLELYLQP